MCILAFNLLLQCFTYYFSDINTGFMHSWDKFQLGMLYNYFKTRCPVHEILHREEGVPQSDLHPLANWDPLSQGPQAWQVIRVYQGFPSPVCRLLALPLLLPLLPLVQHCPPPPATRQLPLWATGVRMQYLASLGLPLPGDGFLGSEIDFPAEGVPAHPAGAL